MVQRDLYLNKILGFLDKPLIKVITGMRRSGKSMILHLFREYLLNKGILQENILYLNFESIQHADILDYMDLYNTIKTRFQKITGRIYVLLDEIQEVAGWERAVNSFLTDFDCDVYITGSNANLLSSELATHIAGRYVEINVYPLSFKEYLDFTRINPGETGLDTDKHFSNFLRFGGLPGIHRMNWESDLIDQYLSDIYNSVLLKDVISRNNIRDTELLRKIILFLMDNIGKTFSAKAISDFLKSQGRKLGTETVYNYLQALESALLIYKVSRYDIKGKKILETQERYFLSDLGMRHAILGFRDNDISGVLENAVYLELRRRGYAVNIGKQEGREVDFIATRREEKIYLQVCYLLSDDSVTDREFAPLIAIDDNYEKVVLSMDSSLLNFNRRGIKRKNIIDFLLENG
ncbi:MAG: ATP-binding protein [Saccharofermentanales bacterium]